MENIQSSRQIIILKIPLINIATKFNSFLKDATLQIDWKKQNGLEIMIVINNHNQKMPDCTNNHNYHNSNYNQEMPDYTQIITTTAALQPGNTGLNQT